MLHSFHLLFNIVFENQRDELTTNKKKKRHFLLSNVTWYDCGMTVVFYVKTEVYEILL